MQSGVAKNEAMLGDRVNGAWTSSDDNNVLTSTLPTVSTSLADTNWHDVTITLDGQSAVVWIDGQEVMNTTIVGVHTKGYLQWQVIGTSPVLLDDVKVTAIDHIAPVAPTGGSLIVAANGTGSVNLNYGHGSSTDSQTVTLYESSTPIQPNDSVQGLMVLGSTSSSTTTLPVAGADRAKYHAASVSDTSGNRSTLLPLTIDIVPPEAINDLRV
jgi:hypothetical protein